MGNSQTAIIAMKKPRTKRTQENPVRKKKGGGTRKPGKQKDEASRRQPTWTIASKAKAENLTP